MSCNLRFPLSIYLNTEKSNRSLVFSRISSRPSRNSMSMWVSALFQMIAESLSLLTYSPTDARTSVSLIDKQRSSFSIFRNGLKSIESIAGCRMAFPALFIFSFASSRPEISLSKNLIIAGSSLQNMTCRSLLFSPCIKPVLSRYVNPLITPEAQ